MKQYHAFEDIDMRVPPAVAAELPILKADHHPPIQLQPAAFLTAKTETTQNEKQDLDIIVSSALSRAKPCSFPYLSGPSHLFLPEG
jgi:hypothetical protein